MVESHAFLDVSNSLNCAVNLNCASRSWKAGSSWAGVDISGLQPLPVYSQFLREREGDCVFLFIFTVLPVLLRGFSVVSEE